MPSEVRFDDLRADQFAAARLAVATLDTSVNVPTQTQVAAVAHTPTGLYAGAQLQLTLPSAVHAEAAAISVAHSAKDLDIDTLYLVSRRFDGRDPGHVMPCGSCCQLIHDVGTYANRSITVISLNEHTRTAQVVDAGELLPLAFASLKLRQAGEERRATLPQASITCPRCRLTSYNPNDIEHKYCGNCHQFHADMETVTVSIPRR